MKVLNSPVIISTLKTVQDVQVCLCCIHTFLSIKYLHLKGYIVYLGVALRRKEKKEKEKKKPKQRVEKIGEGFFIIFCVKCVCPRWVMQLPYTLFLCVCIILSSDNVICLFWFFLESCIATWHEQRQRCHCVCCGYSGFLSHWRCPFIIQTEGPHTVCFSIICLSRRELSLKKKKKHSHTYMNLWWHEFGTTLLNQSKHKNKQQSKGNC